MNDRLRLLFLTALLGVVVMAGVVSVSLGPVGIVVYVAVVAVGLGALARWLRRTRAVDGRTCTCCTSTVHDPVEVR